MFTPDEEVLQSQFQMLRERGLFPVHYGGFESGNKLDNKGRVILPSDFYSPHWKLGPHMPKEVGISTWKGDDFSLLECFLICERDRFIEKITEGIEDDYLQLLEFDFASITYESTYLSKRFTVPSKYRDLFLSHGNQYTLIGADESFLVVPGTVEKEDIPRVYEQKQNGEVMI